MMWLALNDGSCTKLNGFADGPRVMLFIWPHVDVGGADNC